MISQSRHSSGNRVVRMNLANLPGEEDDENGERHFFWNCSKFLLVKIPLIIYDCLTF